MSSQDAYGICNTLMDPKQHTICIAQANAQDFCGKKLSDTTGGS